MQANLVAAFVFAVLAIATNLVSMFLNETGKIVAASISSLFLVILISQLAQVYSELY